MKVTNGPFKDLVPTDGEVRTLLGYDSQPVTRDGKVVQVWGVHHRTRHMLEKFPPEAGWAVRISGERGPFDMEDSRASAPSVNGGEVASVMQPTVQFTAQLVNPEGKVVAEATVLRVINSYASWQAGQTNARGALYDALGLSLSFDDADDQASKPKAAPAAKPTGPSKLPSKLPPQAQAMVDAIESPSVGEPEPPAAPATGTSEEEAGTPPSPADTPSKPTPKPTTAAKPAKAKAAPAGHPSLNKNLLRQAQARAKLLGEPFPEVRDNDHLREVYKGLFASTARTAQGG